MIAPLLAAATVALGPSPVPLLAALPARPRFSYNRRRPLRLRLGAAMTQDGLVRQPLTFDAGRGLKGGFWTHPEGSGP